MARRHEGGLADPWAEHEDWRVDMAWRKVPPELAEFIEAKTASLDCEKRPKKRPRKKKEK
jgi:hypothetical protein